MCDSIVLPNLALGNYYGATNKGGINYGSSAKIKSSIPVFVYAESGTTKKCISEKSFQITIKNAPIIILDEATSSLDTVTESKIQNSIFSILNQTKPTVVAIAHRLSTIRHMDRIIVMDKGMIIEDGSFEQLIKNKHSHFRKLWDNQINNMIV